ncbi:MAG: type I restriction enzyme S subunit [Pseudohongiellaceae bacterium]|jgi:type I restriction enzyme S subunit|nr:restriction endonuclease subunit S [Zhongshania sp.]
MSNTDNNVNAAPQSSHSCEGGNVKLVESSISTSIGEVADVIAGGTPKANDPKNFATPQSGIAWLTPADLSGFKSKYIAHGARDLSESGYNSSSAKLLPVGTIVFSSRAPIGYLAIAQNAISTNQGFKNFVFHESIDSTYAYYYLKSIRDVAESLGTGTTFKEISGSTAKTLPFLIFPLAEQKVIADKLDELLAQVDTLKARLDAIPAILKRFRQSVLAAAVSGKLTEEWRKSNSPHPINAADITEAQFEKGITHGNFGKKLARAPKIGPDEVSAVINHMDGWPLIRIGAICASVVPNRDKPKTFSGGYHWLLTPHFTEDSIKIDYEKIRKGLSQDEVKKYNSKIIKTGNVVMTCVGRLGLSAVLTEESVINQQLHAFIINRDLLVPEYVAFCIRANRSYYEKTATSTTISYLNKTACNSLPIPLPPIEEQTEIVRRVEQLFTYADQVEQQVKNAQARVNQLTQSILAKAFRGELTEQWRQDNPELISGNNSAAALLERIKAERAAATPAKKKAPARKAKA